MAPAKGQVPESILKKRKRDEDWAAKKAATNAETRKHRKSSRKDVFKRAEQYVKEYRDQVTPSSHSSDSYRCLRDTVAVGPSCSPWDGPL